MCTCQHKMHWSVVAILVNLVALALYTTAVASHHWATKTDAGYATHAGLFTACPKINGTCYDTHYHFNEYSHEKGVIIASAVLNVFALIGYYFFTVLSVFFLCGLYEEKRLATYAIITAYFAGFLAAIGIAMYAVAIKRLDYSLSWSFVLAVLGLIVNMAAGILMCVGRNISKMATDEEKPTSQHPIENIDLDVTRRKQWHEEEGQEFGGKLPSTSLFVRKKRPYTDQLCTGHTSTSIQVRRTYSNSDMARPTNVSNTGTMCSEGKYGRQRSFLMKAYVPLFCLY